ncbi:MAG: virulence RhuM family protein [Alphaproteobacteria bacterium]|nr:virulence RhuM family protein [Alphaproteobacteria bacterium]
MEEDKSPQMLIYKTKDSHIDVQIKSETVWLSLLQMAQLFERDKSVISRHLNNIFKEGELEKESVVANFATTAADGKIYKVDYYNLDTIISVGYRVNSKRGVQFRQWATQKLKDYLIQGYSLNQQKITHEGLEKIEKTLNLLAKTLQSQSLVDEKGADVLSLILSYSKTWNLLFKYDKNELEIPRGFSAKSILTYEEALEAIHGLKSQLIACEEASPLFGYAFRG